MTRNEKILNFVTYCANHPEERFWQALRNWSGHNFILASSAKDWEEIADKKTLVDTFHWQDDA